MNKYKLDEIAEIQAGPFGTQLKKDEYVSMGIPMLNSKNIGYGKIIMDSVDYVPATVCSRLPQYILKEGDILFGRAGTRTGTIERHTYVDKEYDGCFQGTNCIRVRCNEKDKALFISYYLWLKGFKQKIENSAGGSLQAYVTTDLLKEFTVEIPKDFDKRANLLKLIDTKIENNHRINETLQQMAHLTYMHHFFKKVANGKIGDIIVENMKSTVQVGEASNITGVYPFFTSGEDVLRWTSPMVDGRNLFLNTGGNVGIKFYVGDAAYSTDTWCISAQDNLADYLYLLLDSIKLEIGIKFFQGTGLKHLQKPLLKERPIYIPSENEITVFNKNILPWLTCLSENIRESEQLITLRDWLLPMLMNGQATITD